MRHHRVRMAVRAQTWRTPSHVTVIPATVEHTVIRVSLNIPTTLPSVRGQRLQLFYMYYAIDNTYVSIIQPFCFGTFNRTALMRN